MRLGRLVFFLFAWTLGLLFVTGCNPGLPAPREPQPVVVETIHLTNQDNIELAGTLFRVEGADLAVTMAHSGVGGEDQTGLHSLAQALAEQGVTVMTFDFRGYGQTGGSPALDRVETDVHAALTYLRDLGFTRIACLGVGLGGLACAKVGTEPDLAGLVLISTPTGGIFTSDIVPEDLASSTYPKLIIVAEEDFAIGRDFPAMAQTIYDSAAEPKRLEAFPGSYHSMELFRSEQGEALQELLLAFFQELG